MAFTQENREQLNASVASLTKEGTIVVGVLLHTDNTMDTFGNIGDSPSAMAHNLEEAARAIREAHKLKGHEA